MDKILSSFPPVAYSFAYGSGVFQQAGYKSKGEGMLDIILVVDDSFKWHRENLQMNREHYSGLMKMAGPHYITHLQDSIGAHVYYNTSVPVPESLREHTDCNTMKYGVIQRQALLHDLRQWDTLYISGRMHKPVRILQHNEEIDGVAKINLSHALNVSLLLLPSTFTNVDLFETISGLSYAGDVRMGIAENPHKVNNIVTKNITNFEKLYRNHIKVWTEISFVLLSSLLSLLSAHLYLRIKSLTCLC